MFKLFGMVLLALALWQLQAIRLAVAHRGGESVVAVSGYSALMAMVLIVMGMMVLVGVFG